jgi:hypothetical protein
MPLEHTRTPVSLVARFQKRVCITVENLLRLLVFSYPINPNTQQEPFPVSIQNAIGYLEDIVEIYGTGPDEAEPSEVSSEESDH